MRDRPELPLTARAYEPEPGGIDADHEGESASTALSEPPRTDRRSSDGRPHPPTAGEPVPVRRTAGQRLEDAGPLLFVAGACFVIGVTLRFTGGSGPVPQLPIWALFLALGLVASLGAGFSMIEGETGDSAGPANTRPTFEVGERTAGRRRPRLIAEAERPGPRIGPADLVSLFWESSEEIMAKKQSTRPAKSRPTTSAKPARSADEPAEAVIADLDRLLDDLRPVRARRAAR